MDIITMALLEFNIPEGALWGDVFYETNTSSSYQTPEHYASESDSDDWETVGQTRMVEEYKAPTRWCRNGNACEWKNCKFRHERCAHYDNWVKRGKRGHNCRCHATDPESKKRPEDGGCKYDHRDLSKLNVFIEALPCSTELELWDSFMPLGLEAHYPEIVDLRGMKKSDVSLLVRSLNAAHVSYEYTREWMHIKMDE